MRQRRNGRNNEFDPFAIRLAGPWMPAIIPNQLPVKGVTAEAAVPLQTKSEVPSSLNDPVQLPVALGSFCLPVPPGVRVRSMGMFTSSPTSE